MNEEQVSGFDEKQELTALLEDAVVEVEFTKVNGDLRKMKCTKNFDSIPSEKHPIGKNVKVMREYNEDVIRVYDVDADGWRSFRADSIKSFKVVVISNDATAGNSSPDLL